MLKKRPVPLSIAGAISLVVALHVIFSGSRTALSIVPDKTFAVVVRSPATQDEGIGQISGVVVDQNGQPAKAISVTAYYGSSIHSKSKSTQTDANGAYTVSGLEAHSYHLEFRDPISTFATIYHNAADERGAVSIQSSTPVTVAENQIDGLKTIVAPGGTIEGTIFKRAGLTLESKVRIALYEAGSYHELDGHRTIVDFGGESITYTFSNLAGGHYRVCADVYPTSMGRVEECFDDVTADLINDAARVAVESEQTTRDVDIVLGSSKDYGQASGRVVNNEGQPLAGTRVEFYRVWNPSAWSPQPTTMTAKRTLERNSEVTDSIDSPDTPTAIECTIALPDAIATTDQGGRYVARYVPWGAYRVSFVDGQEGRYLRSSYTDPADPSLESLITVTAQSAVSNVDGIMDLGGRISGHFILPAGVTDPALRAELLDNIRVTIGTVDYPFPSLCGTWGTFAKTGTDTYEIYGLSENTYVLSASTGARDYGYQGSYTGTVNSGVQAEFPVSPGQLLENVNFVFDGPGFSGEIGGVVTAEVGPVSEIQVDLYSGRRDSSLIHEIYTSTVTNELGEYLFEQLPAANYALKFIDPQGVYGNFIYPNSPQGTETKPIEISTGYERYVDVQHAFVRGAMISGVVINEDGHPLPSVQVYPRRQDRWHPLPIAPIDPREEILTDTEGRFQSRPLTPGLYEICFHGWRVGYEYKCYDLDGDDGQDSEIALTAGQALGDISIVLERSMPYSVYLPSTWGK